MAQYLIQDTTLIGIADAIRTKTDSNESIKVSDMASKIGNITTPVLQEKTVTPTTSVIEVTPDTGNGYNGLSKVIVEAMAGGGGSSAVFASGFVTGTGGAMTITHNLGCVPDLFFISKSTEGSKEYYLGVALGLSDAVLTKLGSTIGMYYVSGQSTGSYHRIRSTTATVGDESGSYLYNATETTIGVGSATYKLVSGANYKWIAIGGLA